MDAIELYRVHCQALLLILLKLRVLLPESLIVSGMDLREKKMARTGSRSCLMVDFVCTFWCSNLKCHFLYRDRIPVETSSSAPFLTGPAAT